eukprot:scaffold21351_cov96-Isochrysis_galbana.AAC.2
MSGQPGRQAEPHHASPWGGREHRGPRRRLGRDHGLKVLGCKRMPRQAAAAPATTGAPAALPAANRYAKALPARCGSVAAAGRADHTAAHRAHRSSAFLRSRRAVLLARRTAPPATPHTHRAAGPRARRCPSPCGHPPRRVGPGGGNGVRFGGQLYHQRPWLLCGAVHAHGQPRLPGAHRIASTQRRRHSGGRRHGWNGEFAPEHQLLSRSGGAGEKHGHAIVTGGAGGQIGHHDTPPLQGRCELKGPVGGTRRLSARTGQNGSAAHDGRGGVPWRDGRGGDGGDVGRRSAAAEDGASVVSLAARRRLPRCCPIVEAAAPCPLLASRPAQPEPAAPRPPRPRIAGRPEYQGGVSRGTARRRAASLLNPAHPVSSAEGWGRRREARGLRAIGAPARRRLCPCGRRGRNRRRPTSLLGHSRRGLRTSAEAPRWARGRRRGCGGHGLKRGEAPPPTSRRRWWHSGGQGPTRTTERPTRLPPLPTRLHPRPTRPSPGPTRPSPDPTGTPPEPTAARPPRSAAPPHAPAASRTLRHPQAKPRGTCRRPRRQGGSALLGAPGLFGKTGLFKSLGLFGSPGLFKSLGLFGSPGLFGAPGLFGELAVGPQCPADAHSAPRCSPAVVALPPPPRWAPRSPVSSPPPAGLGCAESAWRRNSRHRSTTRSHTPEGVSCHACTAPAAATATPAARAPLLPAGCAVPTPHDASHSPGRRSAPPSGISAPGSRGPPVRRSEPPPQ